MHHELWIILRGWRRRPLLTAVIIGTLALGVSATTAVFGVVNALLLRPLPYAAPDRLAHIRVEFPASGGRAALLSGPELVWLAERTRALAGVGAVWARPGVLRSADGPADEIEVGWVTSRFLETLGVAPLVGRLPTGEEHVRSNPDVIVLSYALWQRRYGSDPSIVGTRIDFDEEPRTVVGVMPASFRMLLPPDQGVPESLEAWLPWGPGLEELPRTFRVFTVIARLGAGATWSDVSGDLAAVARTIEAGSTDYAQTGLSLAAIPLTDGVVAEVRSPLLVMFGVVAFVLVIACANVANLLMARSSEQSRELSLRAALGASRGRLWRQSLTESAALGVLGGACGVALAEGAVRALRVIDPADLPRLQDVALDAGTLAFAAAVSLASAMLFGALAASHAIGGASAGLHDATRGVSARTRSARQMLVVSQLAVSVVLLAGAGLLLRSFVRLNTVDLGFDPAGVVSLRLSLPDVRYPYTTAGPAIAELYRRLDDLVRELPGVEAAGATISPPLADRASRPRSYSYRTSDGEVPWGSVTADARTVTPGWFAAARVRLVAGRLLDDRDRWDRPIAVVVDTTLARKAWPDADAVGQQVRVELFREGIFAPHWAEVVGVVEPVRLTSLRAIEREQIYVAHHQSPQRTMFPALRVGGDPLAVVPLVQRAVDELEGGLPVFDVRLASDHVSQAMARARAATIGLSIFSGLALTLAVAGLYAGMAFSVSQRRREIGIRLAVGATPRAVLGMVIRQGVGLAAIGVLIGLGGAIALTRVLAGLLYGVSATDPLTFALVSLVLVAVGVGACWIPARRAARVDPVETLRAG